MNSNVDYDIIASGSDGNAVVLNKFLLVDCGVSFSALKPYVRDLKLVLLTHIHSDHFRKRTIRKLAEERPTLRFGCCRWLVDALVGTGVEKKNIDVLKPDTKYLYGLCDVIPVDLVHNVPNCGYKIHFPSGGKVFYVTDTNNLNGIYAYHYDLYLVEANYEDQEIRKRIKEKQEAGVYPYELDVLRNHLSKQKCDDFVYKNIGANGTYIYMHQHKERENDYNSENLELRRQATDPDTG